MSKFLAIACFFAIANAGFAQDGATNAGPIDPGDAALLERLQSGGLVLLFRHGKTGPDPDRPDAVTGRNEVRGTVAERQAAYFDCDRQRNLSDTGRAELMISAAAMRSIGLVVGEVFSSPMCRTRETAWLLVGRVTVADALIGPDNAERQRLASTIPDDRANRVLVSHGYIVKSIVPNPERPDPRGQVARGSAHVLEPLGEGKFHVLAELAPDDWVRLAGLAIN
jgi:phosphohistidine phosphatase SixA